VIIIYHYVRSDNNTQIIMMMTEKFDAENWREKINLQQYMMP